MFSHLQSWHPYYKSKLVIFDSILHFSTCTLSCILHCHLASYYRMQSIYIVWVWLVACLAIFLLVQNGIVIFTDSVKSPSATSLHVRIERIWSWSFLENTVTCVANSATVVHSVCKLRKMHQCTVVCTDNSQYKLDTYISQVKCVQIYTNTYYDYDGSNW